MKNTGTTRQHVLQILTYRRSLRRTSYDVNEDGKLTEEVAKVLGVPFSVLRRP